MNFGRFNEFPQSKHAWAQADRYALAIGYLNNGMRLFKPESMVLNHQFPNDWETPDGTSRTAVDLPLHEFVIASIMKVFHTNSVFIFRFYTFLISILGLFYLFKIFRLLNVNFGLAVLITVFAETAPVFLFYQNGFLTSISSLSLIIIGVYNYFSFLNTRKIERYNWSILWLTVATLTRTSYAILLIAVIGNEFFQFLIAKKKLRGKWMATVLSIAVILAFQILKSLQAKAFGSIFLSEPIPPNSFSDFLEILQVVYERWFYYYFTSSHYLLVIFLGFIILIQLFKKKLIKRNRDIDWFWVIYSFGVISFSILMLKQFRNHDYYFLDTFYLPLILGVGILIGKLSIKQSKLLILFELIVAGVLVFNAYNLHIQKQKVYSTGKIRTLVQDYTNADDYLDSLGISRNSKLLVYDTKAPNIPFLLMDRKGYAIMNTSAENIKKALSWDYDFIVTSNSTFVSDVYTEYPNILSFIEKIGSNGKITVSERKKSEENACSLFDFLGVEPENILVKAEYNFEKGFDHDDNWLKIDQVLDDQNQQNHYGITGSNRAFGITYELKMDSEHFSIDRTLLFQGDFWLSKMGETFIVVSIQNGDKKYCYKSFRLESTIHKTSSWKKVVYSYQLPVIDDPDAELSFYLWNNGAVDILYDNLELMIY